MIRGIGPVYAKKLVRAFGEKVFDTIEARPERLREVTGIGPVRAKRITDAWAEQKVVREIMVFLHEHGVGTARTVRIYKTYAADAVQVMTENPYRLARDIRGIGFKTADAIAMKLGIEKTAMIRVRAGISFALTEAKDEGHCGLPTEELVPLAEKLLEVPPDLIRTALDLELSDGAVIADHVGDTPCAFLAGLYQAERVIADRLARLLNGKLPGLRSLRTRPCRGSAPHRSQLAESRRPRSGSHWLPKCSLSPAGRVSARPRSSTRYCGCSRQRARSSLCAPTGRAAKRMTEATGFEAKTVHRLLEIDPKSGGFKRDGDYQLDCDLLVVDEAPWSMSADAGADEGGAGRCRAPDRRRHRPAAIGGTRTGLANIIASGAVPVVRLTEVFRQAAQSRIITSAHKVNHGSIVICPSQRATAASTSCRRTTPKRPCRGSSTW